MAAWLLAVLTSAATKLNTEFTFDVRGTGNNIRIYLSLPKKGYIRVYHLFDNYNQVLTKAAADLLALAR